MRQTPRGPGSRAAAVPCSYSWVGGVGAGELWGGGQCWGGPIQLGLQGQQGVRAGPAGRS